MAPMAGASGVLPLASLALASEGLQQILEPEQTMAVILEPIAPLAGASTVMPAIMEIIKITASMAKPLVPLAGELPAKPLAILESACGASHPKLEL
jgi:hypothetical protein